jgi:type II secretory pathway pseudopilin PulG
MRRLRGQEGFGLVELLIAMTVLNVAILATVAAFSSGMLALNRANKTATAAVLADMHMEKYRAVRFDCVKADNIQDSTTCPDLDVYDGAVVAPERSYWNPVRVLGGAHTPDGRTYQVEATIVEEPPAAGVTREVKRVTIVVRDVADSMRILTRQTSTFEEATG